MTLRTQFTAVLCGVVGLCFALSGYVGYRYARDLRTSLIYLHGNQHANVLKMAVEKSLGREQPGGLRIYLKLVGLVPGVRAAYVVGRDGTIAFHNDALLVGTKLPPDAAALNPGAILFERRATQAPGGPFQVRVELSKDAYFGAFARAQRAQQARLVLFVCLGVGAGLAAALASAVFITRPVRVLAQAALRVGGGDLAVEVPVTGSRELRDLSRQFNDMTHRLRELDELKDELISSVSHDLRSPMAAIKMYSDYLLHEDSERDKILPKHADMIAIISDSATKLNVFVSNILDAAKIKAGSMENHARSVAVDGVFQAVNGLFAMTAKKNEIALVTRLAPGLPPVYVDPERLERVLVNLVSNALKFTEASGTIALEAWPVGADVNISVSDTGKGIPKEAQARLFERFYQADAASQKSHKIQGTGLGLYIVKQAVTDMGGAISVDSEPGRGTRFTLRLPARPSADPAVAAR